MTKTAIYMRVSTDRQTDENQLQALQKTAAARGWTISKIYREDGGVTGTKGRDERPALDRMLKDAGRRKFDRIIAWSIDRIGRSTAHVTTIMTELEAAGVEQFYHLQGIDSSTVYGKAMIQMAAVFAELEHGIIRERVKAGLARARAEGKRPGMPPMPPEKIRAIINDKRANPEMSIRAIADAHGVSKTPVGKILKAAGLSGL